MNYAVKKEVDAIIRAYKDCSIDWDTAIEEIITICRLEGESNGEAIDYFESHV